MTLKTGTGYTVITGTASGTLADNDSAKLSVGNASVTEGDKNTTNVNVAVTLSNPSTQTITVVATTVAGTALAGSDFIAKTATLTFTPGTTTMNFTVAIVGDKIREPTEQFTVVLSSPTGGASIANGISHPSSRRPRRCGARRCRRPTSLTSRSRSAISPAISSATRSGST